MRQQTSLCVASAKLPSEYCVRSRRKSGAQGSCTGDRRLLWWIGLLALRQHTRFVPAWGTLLRAASDAERQTARIALFEALAYLEQGLQKSTGAGPFWFGEQPGLVDLTFYPWFERWAALEHHRGPIAVAQFERLQRWRDALAARPSVKEIANPTQFYVERFAKHAAPAAHAAAV
jgi:glutathione S-transferase